MIRPVERAHVICWTKTLWRKVLVSTQDKGEKSSE